MPYLIIIVLCVILSYYVIALHSYKIQNEDLKKEVIRIDSLRCRMVNERDYYKSQIYNLNTFASSIDNKNSNKDKEILEAIKYAMKKSHPDNGGSATDFKKYRDLYNRIKMEE